MPDCTPTTLYRLFAGDGDLLYVGIAGNPGRRFEQHAKDKPWWSEVAEAALEHFESRAEALTAEAVAIRKENPRHNVVYNAGTVRPPSREKLVQLVADWLDGDPRSWGRGHTYQHARAAATIAVDTLLPYIAGAAKSPLPIAEPDSLRWVCHGCRERVTTGYIEVDHCEIARRQEAKASWLAEHGEGSVSINDLTKYPAPAPWRAWHPDCDPDPDNGAVYSIELQRIRTMADVVDWTAHLMEKNWLGDTNWDDLLRWIHTQGAA